MPKIEKVHVPMERDKALAHAKFLIDNGYVKNKTLDELVLTLQKPEEERKGAPFANIWDHK